jgi:hypothetical protein
LKLYERLISCFESGFGLATDDHFLGSLLVIWWCLRAVKCVLPRSDKVGPVAFMSAAASVLAPAAFLHRDEVFVVFFFFPKM